MLCPSTCFWSKELQPLVQSHQRHWLFVRSQEVVDFVGEKVSLGESCESIASSILDRCLATHPTGNRGVGCDNMTCCIVSFRDKFHLS